MEAARRRRGADRPKKKKLPSMGEREPSLEKGERGRSKRHHLGKSHQGGGGEYVWLQERVSGNYLSELEGSPPAEVGHAG